ncbi:MAG: putative ABC exporter domain-containing protein [Betaproteobacteria bacterium]
MIGASLYILSCTTRNRLRVRLKRLREPRYLIGAVVGAAYVYFSFFARLRGSRAARRRAGAGGQQQAAAFLAAHQPMLLGFGGLGLLALAALGWLLPFSSNVLEFSQAEMSFLFPAPVSRRALLAHRLIRSQLALLFGGVIASFVYPSTSVALRLRVGIAVWLLLVTAKVYFAGVTLARARLFARDSGRARLVAWAPVAAMLAALAVVGAAVVRAFANAPAPGTADVMRRVGEAVEAGPARVVLWPFAALLRPALTSSFAAFATAIAGAAIVLAAAVAWVLESDEAFEDVATSDFERGTRKTGIGAGGAAQRLRAWSLAPGGRAEGAFVWKGATQAVRATNRAVVMRVAIVIVAFAASAAVISHARGLAAIVGMFASIGAVVSIVLGPQMLRTDLRQDLLHLEILRTWPVRPAAVVLGEMMWPLAMLTAISWGLTLLALYLSAPVFGAQDLALRVAVAAGVAALTPALVGAHLVIQNGAALMFPAWVPLGTERPRGLDAMGQRLILLAGVMLLLTIAVAPGAIAGGIVWFAFRRVLGLAAIVLGASVCSVVVLVEVLVATEAMGPLYDRIDLVEVERAEA